MINKTQQTLQEKRLREIANEYRRDGYRVVLNPRGSDLPKQLSSYDVDMIASNANETVMIVVKGQASLSESDYIQSLADIINRHKNWRFELVVTNPKEETLPERYRLLDESELMQRIAECYELLAMGHEAAALMLSWATAEGALRLLAEREGISLQQRSPSYVLKYLTSEGLIDRNDYLMLERMLERRNEVVHGFRSARVSEKSFARFLKYVKELIEPRLDS